MFANKMIPAVCGAVLFKMSDKEAFRNRGLLLLHARLWPLRFNDTLWNVQICGSSAICSHFISISCCHGDGETVVGEIACAGSTSATLKLNGRPHRSAGAQALFVHNFDITPCLIRCWLCVCMCLAHFVTRGWLVLTMIASKMSVL